MQRKIPKTVGSVISYDNEDDEWSMKWAIEQAYGKNCRGETGLFYLNIAATSSSYNTDNRIYYMETVPGGYMESTDPEFHKHTYTYNELLDICGNNEKILRKVLDRLCGQDPHKVYAEVKSSMKKPYYKRRKYNG